MSVSSRQVHVAGCADFDGGSVGTDGGHGSPQRRQQGSTTVDGDAAVRRVLRAARKHLGLEVAFIGQFSGGERVFRYVDCDADAQVVEAEESDPLVDSYCAKVASGELPGLLPDARRHPVAAAMPVTHALPVGTT